ncbi:riboflavin synthase [Lactobacillus mulieris]|jgi:riboflavin synthase, alpha subunit|uniref:Riboflavin synthase n=1 Tax=Lactobacillus mulieris TaxID=2508708 RepID=A0AAP3GWP0_9LACO|nr:MULTISPECIES: riboflavin synthase [Lactobacillus]EEU20858.1 riboflavin synthase, alpha subunit [Lactobacillus jensenii 27-2-CHN]EEX23606.1 riboflavin synthase, alpha subunit [Lactobacillus jensenii 115-3-CHN]EFH30204.1 riboflavin synthase, alpha subunit [Lactobacillus jensenii JV-V16]KAA9244117.1 riboflavin synthase [Lactobacillus jensenii]KAA9368748.1 riboflavin synthase [Lactobacillus jensenii]
MFSGLVTGDATIATIKKDTQTITMTIKTSTSNLKGLKVGDSIAVNGCCLTVESFTETKFVVTMMPQTFKKTTFKNSKIGDQVNIERSLQVTSRLEGHIVTGHIDDVVSLIKKQQNENAIELFFKLPDRLTAQVVPQGSIAINGTSLTVMDINKNIFSVGLIPHTQENTNLTQLAVGDQVNVETDILGKYVAKNLILFQGAK